MVWEASHKGSPKLLGVPGITNFSHQKLGVSCSNEKKTYQTFHWILGSRLLRKKNHVNFYPGTPTIFPWDVYGDFTHPFSHGERTNQPFFHSWMGLSSTSRLKTSKNHFEKPWKTRRPLTFCGVKIHRSDRWCKRGTDLLVVWKKRRCSAKDRMILNQTSEKNKQGKPERNYQMIILTWKEANPVLLKNQLIHAPEFVKSSWDTWNIMKPYPKWGGITLAENPWLEDETAFLDSAYFQVLT